MIGGRTWPYWTLIAVLVFAHFLLHLGLGLGASAPDLLTFAVLLAARRLRPWAAAAVGLGFGLLRDALSLASFGADAIALTLVGFLGSRSRDLFVGDSLLFVGLYLFIGKWLHDAIYALLTYGSLRVSMAGRLLVEAPIAALYAAVAGTAVLVAYRLLSGER